MNGRLIEPLRIRLHMSNCTHLCLIILLHTSINPYKNMFTPTFIHLNLYACAEGISMYNYAQP